MPFRKSKKGFVCNHPEVDILALNADWLWMDFIDTTGLDFGDMEVVLSLDTSWGIDITTPNIATWTESPNYKGWFQVGFNEPNPDAFTPEEVADEAMEEMELALAADPKARFAFGRMDQFQSPHTADYFWNCWHKVEPSYRKRIHAISLHYYTQQGARDTLEKAFERHPIRKFLKKSRAALDDGGLKSRQIWLTECGLYVKDYTLENPALVANYPNEVEAAVQKFSSRWAWFINGNFDGYDKMYHLQMDSLQTSYDPDTEPDYTALGVGDLTPVGETFAAL